MNLSKYNYIVHPDNKPHVVYAKENRRFTGCWICKSKTHMVYGTTPEEAYKRWEVKKGLRDGER